MLSTTIYGGTGGRSLQWPVLREEQNVFAVWGACDDVRYGVQRQDREEVRGDPSCA